uniref:Uncharacterized protein n=1 Tax=viral metagenome TaxID=1070528 RepID=A0A6C0F7G3_9ZZZZ|tara:strand:- start:28363 stop:28614 length:252 start_codon:yes stop_codon:yes gene_type:complete
MKRFDYKLFESIPLQELINDTKSDNESTNMSDKESIKSEDHLSEEEYKNNYSFLDSFKKKKKRKNISKTCKPIILVEETYVSD